MRNHEDMKLFAKKSLGQHFLNSKHVLDKIITAGNIKPDEHILEIGPGTGVLTSELLKAGAIVVAVEKDVRAYELLKEKFAPEIISGKLQLILGDILDDSMTESSIFNIQYSIFQPYALIANIPYYITGAILEKFLERGPRPDRMILLVQKEVADRIVARPEQSTGKSKESVLSISVKAFGTPKVIANVPPGAFTPPPTVDSAILAIESISDKLFVDNGMENQQAINHFFIIVKAGFAHKRKYLKRNLEAILDRETIDLLWKKTGLDDKVRAEDLRPSDWVALSTR